MLKIGDYFGSFDDFTSALEAYEKKTFNKYWIRDCRTLSTHIRKFPTNVAGCNAKADLKYYYLKINCINGGRTHTKRGNQKNTLTFKQGCPAQIFVKVTRCGQFLQLVRMNEVHNHKTSKDSFESLPQQRINALTSNLQALPPEILAARGNKKIRNELYKQSGMVISSRDLNNFRKKWAKKNNKPSAKENFSSSSSSSTTEASNFTDGDGKSKTIEDVAQSDDQSPVCSFGGATEIVSLLKHSYDCDNIHYSCSSDDDVQRDNLSRLFFQDRKMAKMFSAYPEVLFVQGSTYCLRRSRAAVYMISVEDSDGNGVIVAVGILLKDYETGVDWFLDKFKSCDRVATKRVEVVITSNKNGEERTCLRKHFPRASVQICLFNVFLTFNREVNQTKMSLSRQQKQLSKRFMIKLAYSGSSAAYEEVLNIMKSSVPEVVTEYYAQNWHPIRNEWVSFYTLNTRSFLNRTNNRLKRFYQKLKSVADVTFLNLEAFLHNLFVYLKSSRINNYVRNSMKSRKVSTVNRADSGGLYKRFLTNFAFRKVYGQVKSVASSSGGASSFDLKFISGDKYSLSTSLHGILEVSVYGCTCSFWKSMGLPCWHIFYLRAKLKLPLYDERLCLERWTRAYSESVEDQLNQIDQRELEARDGCAVECDNSRYITVVDDDDDDIIMEQEDETMEETKNLSDPEKFVIMKLECTKLAQIGSSKDSTDDVFRERLTLVKELITKWSTVPPPDADSSADRDDFSHYSSQPLPSFEHDYCGYFVTSSQAGSEETGQKADHDHCYDSYIEEIVTDEDGELCKLLGTDCAT